MGGEELRQLVPVTLARNNTSNLFLEEMSHLVILARPMEEVTPVTVRSRQYMMASSQVMGLLSRKMQPRVAPPSSQPALQLPAVEFMGEVRPRERSMEKMMRLAGDILHQSEVRRLLRNSNLCPRFCVISPRICNTLNVNKYTALLYTTGITPEKY